MSCVGGGGVLTEESAPVIAQNVMNFINSADFPKGNDVQGTLPDELSAKMPRATRAVGCVTDSGIATDADSDGLDVEQVITMNCSNEISGGASYTTQGSYVLKDLNDSVAGIEGGYEFTYNITNWKYEDIVNGGKFWGSYLGKWTGTGTPTVSTYKGNANGHSGYQFTSSGKSLNLDFNFKYNYDITYTTADAWATSVMDGKGTYEVEGTFLNEVNNNHEVVTGSAVMSWQAMGLVYDPTCANVYYKSGEYRFTDAGGNILKVNYSCSKYVISLNGNQFYDSSNP